MSYIREYLSSPESKSEFCKRHGFCAKLLTYWLNKYQIEDKDMGRSSKPVNSDAIDSSISELQKELSLLRAENRKLHREHLLMRVYVTRRAKNSSILLNPRIISRYEKTPMPSNRHLVTEVLIPTQTWLYKVPL
ncbi:hypothetical protein NXV74_22930 [Bacteroides thetaiotaomicron]|nr:hypothetical protein [Bacteroides thetaiotaomicron]